MKSPKERQRAYRERRKAQKEAGLIKLKVITSAAFGKKLEILSEIDSIDIGNVLGQAIELLWSKRFGDTGIAGGEMIRPEKVMEPEKEKNKKFRNGKKKGEKSGDAKIKSGAKIVKGKQENPSVATA